MNVMNILSSQGQLSWTCVCVCMVHTHTHDDRNIQIKNKQASQYKIIWTNIDYELDKR